MQTLTIGVYREVPEILDLLQIYVAPLNLHNGLTQNVVQIDPPPLLVTKIVPRLRSVLFFDQNRSHSYYNPSIQTIKKYVH